METSMAVAMNATVLSVQPGDLLVRDHATQQEVIVHTASACCFCPGDQVCIRYSGIMTMSLPPQITADCIVKLSDCGYW